MLQIGAYVIETALLLSLLTTGGFLAIFYKLPKRLRTFIVTHPLITDIATLTFAYIVLGGTLTALIAAAMTGLIISILLYLAKMQESSNYENSHHLDT